MVIKAAMSTVTRNVADIIPIIRLSFCVPWRFAIAEDIAKKTSGITATKSRFKKISPIGFTISAALPNIIPAMLPAMIPVKSQIIPL
jgi:hypothetical protein